MAGGIVTTPLRFGWVLVIDYSSSFAHVAVQPARC
jgi:hypothetical protein